MTTIYLAEYKHGRYKIVSVETIKETALTYLVDPESAKGIHGFFWVPSRVSKNKYNVFATLRDAKLYCVQAMEKHLDHLEEQKGDVREKLADLKAQIGTEQSL